MTGVFETQQFVNLSWKDPRIQFHNLKKEDYQNSLLESEKGMIWVPTVTFLNTAGQERSQRDNTSLVTVERLSGYTISDDTEPNNVYIYQGRENTLKISRVYSTEWLCSYEMINYPFDTQVIGLLEFSGSFILFQYCPMTFTPAGISKTFMQLLSMDLVYSGPVELTQYFVRYRC